MKVFIIIVCLLVALLFAAWAWFGGFSRIGFATVEAGGGETIVFESATGDYAQTPQVTNRIYKALLADSIATTRGIGIFYDKPGSVPRDEMRSDIGCIIDGIDLSTLAVLSAKYGTNREQSQTGLQSVEAQRTLSNYRVRTLPKGRFLVVEFPWRGGLSSLVGVLKVYPALEKFCTANSIPTDTPITEIYDIPARKIIYRREI